MRFTIPTKDLATAVLKASQTLSQSDSNALLRNFFIKAADNELRIVATDLDLSVVSECRAAVKEPGEITVPGEQFLSIATRADGDEFRMQTEADVASIKVGSFEASLKCLAADDYPSIEKFPAEFKVIDTKALAAVLQLLSFAVYKDDARKNLTVIYVNDGHFQATDGQIGVVFPLDTDITDTTIPSIALEALISVLKESEEKDTHIASAGNFIYFRLGQDVFVSRTEHSKFPDLMGKFIIPTAESPFHLKMDRSHFISVMNRVSATSDPERKSIRFAVHKSESAPAVELSSKDSLGNNSKEVLACEWSGPENFEFFLNYDYVHEICQRLKDNNLEMRIADSVRMPVRIQEEKLIIALMRLGG